MRTLIQNEPALQTQTRSVFVIDLPLYAAALNNTLFRPGEKFRMLGSADCIETAQARLHNEPVDLLLVELNLYDFDFLSLVQDLRQSHPQLQIVGFSDGSQASLSAELGLDAFFLKPPNLLHLHPWRGAGLRLLDGMHELFQLKRTVKIMLVDDAALMLKVLNQVISEDEQLEVISTVRNGQEALEQLKEHQPDVILLDIEMPIMDGLTFLRHARVKSRARVIILSSVAMQGSNKAAEARRLGADAVIAKPSGAVSLNLAQKSGKHILDSIYSVLRTGDG